MDKNIIIFAGDGYMVKKSLDGLKASLNIPFEEINITGFKSMPDAQTLIEACAALPLMSDIRLVYVLDCTALTAEGNAEEAKKIAAYLDRCPNTTVLALCAEALDKRRALYKRVKEIGTIHEFPSPKPPECIAFVTNEAKRRGATISAKTAAQLVSLVGCDYYSLENEIEKLAVYSGFKEILPGHVTACASRTLEYNVFELHNLLIGREVARARELLGDVLSEERPEGLVGLFAKKFRDMYKIKTMVDVGYNSARIAAALNMKEYPVQITMRECARFSQQLLRDALCALAELDYAVKSGEKDPQTAMEDTLIRIYGL